ncbi:MAG: glycoside hydrolase family 95 protein [Asticcacaulis sp.]|uniref:glycoside hydrolase family 95 protein n=1 Tax=Asticcacaulis sp. TaxID=1872648 RepID=UPI0039E4A16F
MRLSRRQMMAATAGMAAATAGRLNAAPRKEAPLSLWYEQPAKDWSEALPLGNGHLGAMVFGTLASERFQINESTLWGGAPHDYSPGDRTAELARLRAAIFEDRLDDAVRAGQDFMGDPATLMPYQPFVDLLIDMPGHDRAQAYRRDLRLDQAVHTVSYERDGVVYRRESFASFPDKALVIRLTADTPGKQSFRIRLTSPQTGANVSSGADGALLIEGQIQPRQNPDWSWTASWDKPGLSYAGRLRVVASGGAVRADGDALVVEGADAVTLLFCGATSFKTYNDVSGDPLALTQRAIDQAGRHDYAHLKAAHLADHQALFDRVSLRLGAAADLPTDQRLLAYKTTPDPALEALFFQYGRYLLIAASRPGGQPANLQGIWNNDLLPAWSSKMTTNINLQMNYWIAETGDLWETQTPLWDLIDDLQVTGAKTARDLYGGEGWVLHHNTDIWRATTPVDGPWGIWPTGGVWLANQMWDHYLYSQDRDFLTKRCFPAMRGAVAFALGLLVEAPAGTPVAGKWVSNPTISPENQYLLAGKPYHLTYGAAMDTEMIGELFDSFIVAADALNITDPLLVKAKAARQRLPAIDVNQNGGIREWIRDYAEAEPHHRHTSHLYGLYPGQSLTPQVSPALAAAARKTLDLRTDEGTGWSMAWRTALRARLRDGNHAHVMLRSLISQFTQPNLLDVCPPFQIDGNFGGPAGIAEMLVQSRPGAVDLLPALPDAWPQGEVRGLRARGGLKVDMTWDKGRLNRAVLHSPAAGTVVVRYGNTTETLDLKAGANLFRPSKRSII